MPKLFFVLVTLLGALTACGPNETTSKTPPVLDETTPAPLDIPETAPKVIFLGDSISAGLHLKRPTLDSFPALVQRQLHADGLPFHLVNAGASGDTSASGLRRLDWLLKQKPDLLVVELGGNDGLRGQPIEALRNNLDEILKRTRAAGVRALLFGMQIPPNIGVDYARDFAALYEELAVKNEADYLPQFLDGVGGHPELNHPDMIHPNLEGHRLLAQKVAPQVATILFELR